MDPSQTAAAEACPCGRNDARGRRLARAACCGRWRQPAEVPDAEALMRSRYSAFVRGDTAWLLATWHPSTRPEQLELDPQLQWLGLALRARRDLGPGVAEVEFVARSRWQGRGQRQHERSRFVWDSGQWWYLSGEVL